MPQDPAEAVKGPHHLIALEAQNVKRIEAISLTFGGAAVAQITGRNEQGKSSLLDTFRWAVDGARSIQSKPIRAGAEEAKVRLDFGKIVVTKTLRATDDGGYRPTLVVTTADGVKLSSPQAVLDAWLGPLTFDPLALVRAAPDERADMVKALVPDFDFAAVERANKDDYDRRTQIGRDRARERSAAASIVVPDGTPAEMVDVGALSEEYRAAHAHNAALTEAQKKYASADELRREAQLISDEAGAIIAAETVGRYGTVVVDLEEIKARGQNAQAVNSQVQLRTAKTAHERAAEDADRRYEALTEVIEAREREMRDAIAAAELPVPGLTFTADDVLVDGLPFDQASSAKQLQIAVALSMKMNPSLRVIRIKDGALLDDDHMRLIEQMAVEAGYLVLMERVTPVDGVGMVVEIEGGKVKAVKPAANRATSRKK